MNNKRYAFLLFGILGVLFLNPALTQIAQSEPSISAPSPGGSNLDQPTQQDPTTPIAPATEQPSQENPNSGQPTQEATPTLKGNYDQLKAHLQSRAWRDADAETYQVMLAIAGTESETQGRFATGEWQTFSCPDLMEIDRLWREASDNKLGFSVQKRIFDESFQNPIIFYNRIKWFSVPNRVWLVAWEYKPGVDPAVQYRPEREPDFANPSEGHLPAKLAWEPSEGENSTADHRFDMMLACGM